MSNYPEPVVRVRSKTRRGSRRNTDFGEFTESDHEQSVPPSPAIRIAPPPPPAGPPPLPGGGCDVPVSCTFLSPFKRRSSNAPLSTIDDAIVTRPTSGSRDESEPSSAPVASGGASGSTGGSGATPTRRGDPAPGHRDIASMVEAEGKPFEEIDHAGDHSTAAAAKDREEKRVAARDARASAARAAVAAAQRREERSASGADGGAKKKKKNKKKKKQKKEQEPASPTSGDAAGREGTAAAEEAGGAMRTGERGGDEDEGRGASRVTGSIRAEEPPVDDRGNNAAVTTKPMRTVRKRLSRATGWSGFFSGKRQTADEDDEGAKTTEPASS